MTIPNRFQMAATAQAALNKLKSSSAPITESTRTAKTDFGRYILEEYDEKAFVDKVRIDTIFYKTLFKNLSEHVDEVQQILGNFFNTIKDIYEHENLKPRVYGFQIGTAFNSSDKELYESANRMINDFVKKQYYSLSQEAREEKYFPQIKQIASDVILKEHVSDESAVQFASKTAVMKDLIERISFPLVIRERILQDLIDENYARIFDQDKLNSLWETFQEQCVGVAKLVASIV